MHEADEARESYDVVVLGAGYAGLMAALRLGRHQLRLSVALINGEEPLVERVRLQETIVAPVKPRIRSLSAYLARRPVRFIPTVVDDAVRRRVRCRAGPALLVRKPPGALLRSAGLSLQRTQEMQLRRSDLCR